MARETKSQRTARQDKELAERTAAMALAYTAELMQVLERASALYLPLTVKNSKFEVEVTERGSNWRGTWRMALEFDEYSFDQLNSLTCAVEELEERKAEAERVQELRKSAVAKLTQEELKAMGW